MTKIEWTEETWNPVVGCTRVSAGCDHCYAVPLSHQNAHRGTAENRAHYAGLTVLNSKGARHFNGTVRCLDERLDEPLKRKKPTTWFVNSMSDLFHGSVPEKFLQQVFRVMQQGSQHIFQILTKRPNLAATYLSDVWVPARLPVLPNVWLGTSVENQEAAEHRIPYLSLCSAAVRFLSCEPLLGPIDFRGPFRTVEYYLTRGAADPSGRINWVIVGGESGPDARECKLEWIESIVHQCRSAGVPVFVKQMGSILGRKLGMRGKGNDFEKFPESVRVREYPSPDDCLLKG